MSILNFQQKKERERERERDGERERERETELTTVFSEACSKFRQSGM